jgi:hypothetical protein
VHCVVSSQNTKINHHAKEAEKCHWAKAQKWNWSQQETIEALHCRPARN